MGTILKLFSCHLLKQFIVFIIICQQVFCQDLEVSNGNTITSIPSPSQKNLIHPLFTGMGKNTLLTSRSRQIRSTNYELKNITLCLSKIKEGEINEAAYYFNELNSVSISDIIKMSYHGDNIKDELKHFKHIIDFVLRLQDDPKDHKLAIETIYNLFKPTTSDTDSWKAVLFYYLIENSDAQNDLTILYIKLMVKKNHLRKIIERCNDVILNKGYDEKLRDFETSEDYYYFFMPLLKEIYLKAIRNKSNVINKFDNILYYIKHYYPTIEDYAEAYSMLYEELKNHDLLSNTTLTQKLGEDVKSFLKYQSNIMNSDKRYRDPIVAVCNALDSCKSK